MPVEQTLIRVLDASNDGYGMAFPSDQDAIMRIIVGGTAVPARDTDPTRATFWQRSLSWEGRSHSAPMTASPRQQLESIIEWTRLDIGAIAATLGVSRRSVHLWRAGGNVGKVNAGAIEYLFDQIRAMRSKTSDPSMLRSMLEAANEIQPSKLAQWRTHIINTLDAQERTQPTAVALLSEDTVSNAPAIGLGREDPDVPSLDVE